MDNRSIDILKGLTIDIVQNAHGGHLGIGLGAAPIMFTLFTKHLKVNPSMPEIDIPAHMQGFFNLAKNKYGNSYLTNIAVNEDEVPGELNITKEEGKKFVRDILNEYTEVFKGSKYFHIGGDEYFTQYKNEIVEFINNEVAFLKSKCFKVVMWNDLFHKDSIKNIDHDIIVV